MRARPDKGETTHDLKRDADFETETARLNTQVSAVHRVTTWCCEC